MIWLYGAVGILFLLLAGAVGLFSALVAYLVILNDPVNVELQYPLSLDYKPFVRMPSAKADDNVLWTYRNAPESISKKAVPGVDEDSVIFSSSPQASSAVSWTHIGNNNTLPRWLIAQKEAGTGWLGWWRRSSDNRVRKLIKNSNQTIASLEFDFLRFRNDITDTRDELIMIYTTVYDVHGDPYASGTVSYQPEKVSNVQHYYCNLYYYTSHILTAALPIDRFVDRLIDVGWCRRHVKVTRILFPRLLLIKGAEYFRIRFTSLSHAHYAIDSPKLRLRLSAGGIRGFLRRHHLLVTVIVGLTTSVGTFCTICCSLVAHALCVRPPNNTRFNPYNRQIATQNNIF